MDFEEALVVELSTITSLSDKVFPLNATEGTKAPYLVYVSSEGVKERTLDGYLDARELNCELHILDDQYSDLKDITKQVISIIDSFNSRIIGGTDGIYVQSTTYEKVTEQYVPDLFQYLCVLNMKVRL